jgi:hypothetical protein
MLQQIGPKLSCENTSGQQVIDGLPLLVKKGALTRMWKVTSCQSVQCSAAIMSHKPNEEMTLVRHPGFPNSLPIPKVSGPFGAWQVPEPLGPWVTSIQGVRLLLSSY